MTVYADPTFFFDRYGGSSDGAAAFPLFAARATQIIKAYAGANIDETDIPECVKMCCCDLVQLLMDDAAAAQQTDGVKSESVGEWNRTYEGSDARQAKLQTEIQRTVELWLSGTGLLFRGIRSC